MAGIDWDEAILYARLVAAAESVDPANEYSQGNIDAIQELGYTFLQTIYGDELATDIDPHAGETVTYGFLAVSQAGEIVAALRGTDTILEWIHDAAFLMVTNPVREGAGMTEDGFTAIYESLRTGRDEHAATVVQSIAGLLQAGRAQQKVTVTGHSLGGALATLLTLDVALNTTCRTPVVYTFASPRVGDHLFAGSFNAAIPESYRLFNRFDLVPNLPPILPLPYEHTNALSELVPPKDAIQANVECEHHLTTYLWLLGQQAGQNVYPVDAGCRGGAYPGPA
ncbi:MAG: lipase family protein [Terracidiphilus sp.]